MCFFFVYTLNILLSIYIKSMQKRLFLLKFYKVNMHTYVYEYTHTHTLIQTYVCVCSSWQWFCCWCCVVFDIFPDDFTAVADISLLLILLLLLMLLMFVYNKEVQWRSGCNHINFLTMYVDIQIFQHKFVLKLCS